MPHAPMQRAVSSEICPSDVVSPALIPACCSTGARSRAAAGGQLKPVGDEQQQVIVQETEQLLRLMQHLDQSVLLELMLLDVRLQDLEALVATGVLQNPGQSILLLTRKRCNHIAKGDLMMFRTGFRCRIAHQFPPFTLASPLRCAGRGLANDYLFLCYPELGIRRKPHSTSSGLAGALGWRVV